VHPVLEAALLTGLFPPNTTLGIGKIPDPGITSQRQPPQDQPERPAGSNRSQPSSCKLLNVADAASEIVREPPICAPTETCR
jgi:hypothetical protein